MAESYIGKPCPKCRYVRTPADKTPDWQCPKCGKFRMQKPRENWPHIWPEFGHPQASRCMTFCER